MVHLIDKDALVAEIERLRKNQVFDDRHSQGVLDGLHAIEKFIDILEVKEVDLESEMDKYFETMEVLEHENIFEVTFQRIAKHFFELGLKTRLNKKIS